MSSGMTWTVMKYLMKRFQLYQTSTRRRVTHWGNSSGSLSAHFGTIRTFVNRSIYELWGRNSMIGVQLFAKTLATALVGEKKIVRPPKIGL